MSKNSLVDRFNFLSFMQYRWMLTISLRIRVIVISFAYPPIVNNEQSSRKARRTSINDTSIENTRAKSEDFMPITNA
jgi:hypothetical protein